MINVVVISLHSTGIAYRSSKIRWKLKYRYLIETVCLIFSKHVRHQSETKRQQIK